MRETISRQGARRVIAARAEDQHVAVEEDHLRVEKAIELSLEIRWIVWDVDRGCRQDPIERQTPASRIRADDALDRVK